MQASQEQFFPASYDKATRITSACLCAVLAVVVALSGSKIALAVGALTLGLSYAWSPRGYFISGRTLFVKRLISNARISLEDVREARPAAADDFRGCIRLFGNGGLFGYYGTFSTSKLGKSTWYVTNRANAVVIVTAGRTVLVSPDDAPGFLNALRASAAILPGPPVDSVPSYRIPLASRIGPLVGLAIAVVVLAVAALALWYSPGPPGYTLTSDSLTIHDRFYPVTLHASSVAVDGIRVVDTTADPQWRPTTRTNGFANDHYRSGWFRLANGQTVRMYSAGSPLLVLLPPKGNGAAVLLETRNPQVFAAEVRRKWSPAS